jgi:hypothetical protein
MASRERQTHVSAEKRLEQEWEAPRLSQKGGQARLQKSRGIMKRHFRYSSYMDIHLNLFYFNGFCKHARSEQ